MHHIEYYLIKKLTSRHFFVAGLIDEIVRKSRLLRRALSIVLLMSRERELVVAQVDTLPPDLQGAGLRESVQHVDGLLAQRRRRRRHQFVVLAVGSPGAVVARPRASDPPTAARSLHHQQHTQHQHDDSSHASRE